MSSLVQLGLANAVCAAVLAALALIVGRFCRRPAALHALWALVLLKLVTPVGLWPLSVPVLPAEEQATVAARAGNGTTESKPVSFDFQVANDTPPQWTAISGPLKAQRAPEAAAAQPMMAFVETVPSVVLTDVTSTPLAPAAPKSQPATDWWLLAGAAWAVGAMVWYGRAGLYILRFSRLLRFAQPAPPEAQRQAEELSRRLGLSRCPSVWVLPGALSPMVWAVRAARIYFPAGLLERLGEQERGSLLAHELAHVRRGDHWMRWFEVLVLGLFWWYPVAWLARARLQSHEEECCDAWVVSVTSRRVYAAAILDAVDFMAEGQRLPALASGLGGVHVLKRRLTRIMTGGGPRCLSRLGQLGILLLGIGALPLLPTLVRSEKAAAPAAIAEREEAKVEPPRTVRDYPIHLVGGNRDVFSLAVSRDGRFLASGSGLWDRPGELKLFSLQSRREVFTFHENQGLASVAFSFDGTRLVTGGYNQQVKVREVPSGKVFWSYKLDGVARATFSPDSKLVAVATESKKVQLLDAVNGNQVANLQGDLMRFHCLTFSPDGKRLLAGGGDWDKANESQVTIWDVGTRKQVGKLMGHPNPILCVAFSQDGNTIATGAVDQTVRVWDAGTLREKAVLTGHDSWVESLAFTPDGSYLVSGSHDGTVRLWDLAKKAQAEVLTGHQPPVRSTAITPDGKVLITGGGTRGIKLWDLPGRKEIGDLAEPMEQAELPVLLGTSWAPDGKTIALVGEDRTVQLRSPQTGDLIRVLSGHKDAVTCVDYAPTGTLLATGSPDLTVKLWDPAAGREVRTLTGHKGWVYALQFAPGGKVLASAGYDKTVRLWDVATGRTIQVLEGHTAAVRAVAFAPDGRSLVTGGSDHTLRTWDAFTGRQLGLYNVTTVVRAVAFSPDATFLVSGDEDGGVQFWDATAGAASLREKVRRQEHKGEVTSLTFAPAGPLLVSTGADGVRLWDAPGARFLAHLTGNGSAHRDAVTGAAFSRDGRFLITVGVDHEVLRWSAQPGK
jgi:WD40 repeat protein/beta-lactamase regulating signal transducer with metallopeptidase domain